MTAGQPEHLTLTAPDISCGHCESTVSKVVGALPGVLSVESSAQTKRVEVDIDPDQVTVDQIMSAMAAAGYSAEPVP